MSDAETTAAPPPPPSDQTEPQIEEPHQEQNKPEELTNVTFSIWPPTQRTRDAVIKSLIETLSTPSVLSKRYGTMPQEEAAAAARVIEEEAFSAASGNVIGEDNGIEILQFYSREISKRMLEAVKVRSSASASASASSSDISAPQTPSSSVPPIASVES